MVLLDTRAPRPESEPLPGTSLRVRAATAADLPGTARLELAGASLMTRMFPGPLVRWSQRFALSRPGAVALVGERPGPDGRPQVAGIVMGTRRGLVELLVVDDVEPAEPVQAALLGAFLRACRDRRQAGQPIVDR